MQRIMLKSKLHRASVTDANIDYEGSIAIDQELMDAAGIVEYEQVQIYNISNGNRFTTYAISAAPGSSVISINGAAAHLARINDRIIIAAYGIINVDAKKYEPKTILLDTNNRIVERAVP